MKRLLRRSMVVVLVMLSVVQVWATLATDDFSTDPDPRWTDEISTATWDDPNDEYDLLVNVENVLIRYSSAPPGDIEHEAQITQVTFMDQAIAGPAVRVDGAANDFYSVTFSSGTLQFNHFASATTTAGRTTLDVQTPGGSVTYTTGNWYTIRMSAQGTSGNNVVLNVWLVDHGSSKPADPDWIGVVGSPMNTYTDSDAARLDDGALHLHAGIGGLTDSNDYDTRSDFYKQRTIADRSGGAPATVRTLLLMGVGQ